ncbi:MAG: isopeptide-forming domain-containing fimbrial protein [Sphingomonas sp.]
MFDKLQTLASRLARGVASLAKRLAIVALVTSAALLATPAVAQSTASGTNVTNNVTVDYQVSGVQQPQLGASNTFTVDRRVDVTVAEIGNSTTQVTPGMLAAVTSFQVTNLTNAPLDFALAVAQQTGGAGAHANTDNFDVTNVRIYVDTNSNGSFDGGDALVTYLDELPADAIRTVFVVVDVPTGRLTNDVAAVTLTATGREAGGSGSLGAALVATVGANTSGVDTVFADGAGISDGTRDAAFSARDDYTVQTAALSVVKTAGIVSDPVNGTTNPKFIPGAVVEYCIMVTNAAGGANATSVAISDPIPTQLTYLGSFGVLVGGTVTSGACNADGANTGTQSSGTVTGTIATLTAGQTRTLLFRATIR